MKLRIHDNSIRLRLGPAEVARLAETGIIEDRLEFPGGTALVYRLQSSGSATSARATFKQGVLAVTVPAAIANAWASNDQVSLTTDAPQNPPTVVIEKDFECLHKEDELGSDTFPNPLMTAN